MATLAKGSAFIFLMTFLVYTGKAQLNSGGHFGGGLGGAGFGGGGHAGGGLGGADFGGGAHGVGLGGSNVGGGGHAGFGSGAGAGDAFAVRKIQVVEPVPLGVNHPAIAAVPIHFDMADYNGPYDPLDPQGIAAAAHRQAKISQRKNADLVKSYVPPGLGEMVKKETIKTLVNEGRRFAVAHPKETAELVGIAAKAKALVNTANRKLESVEKKEGRDRD